MNPLVKRQLDLNQSTAGYWDLFAAHRRHVTAALRLAGQPNSRLCVLGAGNCNDIELPDLLATYNCVQLVDLDSTALQDGANRQQVAGNRKLVLRGGVDLSTLLPRMASWTRARHVAATDFNSARESPAAVLGPQLGGPFDVVASICLLSQLIDAVVRSLGDGHGQFIAFVQAVRLGHLRLLMSLVAPGGVGLLITDFVSSDSFAALPDIADHDLPALLIDLVRQRNFYHGLNPSVIEAQFRTDSVLNAQVALVEPLPPWRWNMGSRTYAVCGLKLHKVTKLTTCKGDRDSPEP